ncbi:MAG: T9SS type A sorting domain-containing protein [Bacteroidia bacterium]|nr:T9SS type A sorting domain-containing protein [Bacteroidia bacterium]
MKKLLLLLCLALLTFNYSAQTGLTNLSFENWTTNFIGPAPTGWFGTGVSKQTTGAQQGNNYVRIKSNNTTQGVLMLGTITNMTGSFTGGEPYTQLPISLTGFYKGSDLITNSNAAILNAYTKQNGQVNTMAMTNFSVDASNWTSFSAQFFAIGGFPNGADSLYIVFNSGSFNSAAVLDLDNLSIQTPTLVGVDEQSLGTSFLVYPNPAQSELNIVSKNENNLNLTLFGMDGKIIQSETIKEGDNKILLSNYPAGIYLYRITDTDQNVLLKSKIIIEK